MLSLLSIWQAKSSRETCETEDANILRIPNSPMFSCVFFREVRDFIDVWTVNEHRVTVHRSDLVELVGLITCVEGGLGQIAKLLVLVRRCACPALIGQVSTARTCGQKGDVKVGVQEQQRRLKHKKGEGEMKRNDTTPFLQTLEPCVYVWHAWKNSDVRRQTVQQKNVRATGECMHITHRTHCSCYYMCTKHKKLYREESVKKKLTFITHDHLTKILQFVALVRNPKNSQTSSFHVRLDPSYQYLFHQLALHQSLWVEASRFPEACVPERPTFLISWFSMMPLYGSFPIV